MKLQTHAEEEAASVTTSVRRHRADLVILRMFRTPHTKTCLNQLRLVSLLRYTHERGSPSLRRDDVQHKHFCSSTVSRAFSDALDSPKHVCPPATIRIHTGTRFLLTHMSYDCMNWLHIPNAFLLFLHTSQSPTNRSKCQKSGIKKCCSVLKRSTESTSIFRGLTSIGPVLCKAAVQTRGLHRNAPQRPVMDQCLSAGNEARCRRSLQANAALYAREGKSWAAVLVCLCAVSGVPALLFTLRSATLKGRHKGDVSFAGGKKDPSDRTVVDTALREAHEELGIHISEEKVWGVLKPLRDTSGMMIAPVIANLGPLEVLSFQPNPSEVEEIFTLTLEHLCQPQNRGYTHFRTGDRYGYTLPVFHSPKHRVWGLTAVALDHTLKVIVPPEQLLDHSVVQ
ncbi:mitochondrial coenzyme A diphosphatase NUDT8 [Carassius auratus]|uniref:Mitochondrial coenzyme A diphosphatase NUDT8 n=1 Tax=Carassius auratus TaxID=7957 RepID=A0A6P6R044_CARAU|nr:nucleoside diphosphate-linked moiety X motif 8 [Carassius auratus]